MSNFLGLSPDYKISSAKPDKFRRNTKLRLKMPFVSAIVGGMVAALGCFVITVLATYSTIGPQSASRYIAVSWLTVGLCICALAAILVLQGWIAATSFTTTFVLLSIFPLFLSYLAIDVLCVLVFISVVATVSLTFLAIVARLFAL
jgi:FtsH-binding integral membrane protein